MKHIYYFILVFWVAVIASGCIKDRTNYDFAPKEVITVTGINSSYTLISEKDRLTLTPQTTSTVPNADFEYLWGIYETNVQGFAPVLDTIGRTKDLDYLIKQPAKGWVLVYRVTNKNTGYAAYFTSSINVVTEFTRGWYVAKDDGNQADMDLFLTPKSIIPESVNENAYSKVNGTKLNGQAQFLTFFSSYKSLANGTATPANTRVLIMSTNKDIAITNINTLKPIRTIKNILFSEPDVKSPAQIFNGSSAYYFFNGGQLHTIYNMSANDGRFGAQVMKDVNNTPYQLSKYFLSYWISDPFFFDETSSSFLSMSMGYGSLMALTTDDPTTTMPANNNNKKLLYMGTKAAGASLTGIAIFQDKTNSGLKIFSTITAPSTRKLKIVNDTLKTTDRLYQAGTYTVLNGDENMIYFALDNQIWSKNLSNGFEKLEYTIPAGEELTYLRHKKYTSEATYAYNFIIIGTKVGLKYKVRMFEKSSGSIVGEPKVTLEGNGIARDVYYVSPSVSETTHTLTY